MKAAKNQKLKFFDSPLTFIFTDVKKLARAKKLALSFFISSLDRI